MDFHASTRFTLVALLTLATGCADDGPSDDEAAGDTGSEDDSTSSDEGTSSESGSTDDDTGSTQDADTSDSTSSTDDSTESTDESTESTDDTTTETTDTTGETESSETNDTNDTADTNDTGEEIMCPGVFPQFDKTCSNDDDCAVVIHTTDCCGNSVALGINEVEVDAFEAAEAICDSQYPPCGCPAGPTLAEDGNQVFDPDQLAVECTMGSCTSFVL
jgi:hypothetical protein